jgi:hypothetical protein
MIEDGPTLIPVPLPVLRVGAWRRAPDGTWRHAPWWKVAINTVLRWLQPRARWKWVVYTECADTDGDGPPRVLGYGFGPIEHIDVPEDR